MSSRQAPVRLPDAPFPARFARTSPSETAQALIAEARRILRDAILTDEDRQFADWARTAGPAGVKCRCGKRAFANHAAAAQFACNQLLHEETGNGRWKVYTCAQRALHVGR